MVLLIIAACGRDGETVSAPQPGSGAADAEPVDSLYFVDIAAEAGLSIPSWYGRTEKPHLLESAGTGLALFDYDGDGDLDLYQVNGWHLEGVEVLERCSNVLYRNRGDGTFEDVTEEAGVGDAGWGCGVGVGDPDGDGDPDLMVTNFGPDVLYLNQGDGTFRADPQSPGIDGWSAAAVFFDADSDGDEDLFVAAYIDSTLEDVLGAEPTLEWHDRMVMFGPFGLEGAANRYFENEGSGRFREATEEVGLRDVGLFYSFGVLALDLDEDLDIDLYVANDSNPNYVYKNDGTGHFDEVGLWSGASLSNSGMAQAGMGLAAGDVDGDGLVDLFVTNFSEDYSTFYRNKGDLLFADVTRRVGVHRATYAALSWGTALLDLDLDADLDLFVANGHIYPQADEVLLEGLGYRQPNQVFVNEGGRFSEVSSQSGPGLGALGSSRGLAVGDIDGDGDLDMAVSNVDEPPTLLRNDSPRRGRWLIVDAPGAVRIEAVLGEQRIVRHALIGGSFLSVSDRRFHLGLGQVDVVDELTVKWPDGARIVLKNVAVDRVVRVDR